MLVEYASKELLPLHELGDVGETQGVLGECNFGKRNRGPREWIAVDARCGPRTLAGDHFAGIPKLFDLVELLRLMSI